MSTKPRTSGINWFLFCLSILVFLYAASLGWKVSLLGRLPESGPEYLLFGSFVSAAACTFATLGWSFSVRETRDVCLGLATCFGIIGLGILSYGLHLLN